MDIGKLRHRITFQKMDTNAERQNDYGETIGEWIDIKTVSANVNPVSGRDFFAAETVNSEVTHKINMRYMPGLTPDMRIKFGDRHFNIISIINFQERNVMLQLLCKELI